MSMLTEQAKKLRETAAELCQYGTHFGYSVTRDPLMRDAAWQMVNAADTIENLRNRLTDTCRNIAVLNADGTSQYYFVCSACGLAVDSYWGVVRTDYVTRKDGTKDYQTFCVGDRYEFERCPSCGRKVV